jgi:hypothetical protein
MEMPIQSILYNLVAQPAIPIVGNTPFLSLHHCVRAGSMATLMAYNQIGYEHEKME